MNMKYLLSLIGWCLLSCLSVWSQPSRQVVVPEKEANSFRFMTYNIRNGLDITGKLQPATVAEVLLKVAPDVVALQEVDSATQRTGGIDMLKVLGEQCMMYHTFSPLYEVGRGIHGLGVLSKERPLGHRSLALPGKEEARGVLLVEFKEFVFCCTQLSKDEHDGKASVPKIFDFIKDLQKPVFLAGDMNCDFLSPSQSAIQSKFRILNDYKETTIPVINEPNIPYTCIDFIYGHREGYK